MLRHIKYNLLIRVIDLYWIHSRNTLFVKMHLPTVIKYNLNLHQLKINFI